MKVIPFINTILNEQYRVFILNPFNKKDILNYFKGWHDKDMVSWNKHTNIDSNISFEFYGEGIPYKIKNPELVGNKSYTFPYPKNLDQFICDCQRCLVTLHWQERIVDTMNRIFFMDQSEIENYNIELLNKIDKV